MKVPRDLSGDELVRLLCNHWDYQFIHQRGSHMILQTEKPSHHRVAVPAHKFVRIGTLNSILRSIAHHKGVDRETILNSTG